MVKVKVEDGDLIFEKASLEDNKKLDIAKEKVKKLIECGDVDVPSENLWNYSASGGGALSIFIWGFNKFYKLFNPRQLLTLIKITKLIREVGKRVEEEKLKEGWNKEKAFKYSEAIATYLSIALLKHLDYNTTVTLWNAGSWSLCKIAHTLTNRGISMQWNWCEMYPIVNIPLAYPSTLKTTINSLEYLTSALSNKPNNLDGYLNNSNNKTQSIKIIQGDATALNLNEKFDVIVTDPLMPMMSLTLNYLTSIMFGLKGLCLMLKTTN
uniref:hypothetical protein n=1 Tax=Methanotorris formicicus TaxID=213185 RepID=UPI001FDEC972|nr:hypothetical protein [Methanotorris formicicus]